MTRLTKSKKNKSLVISRTESLCVTRQRVELLCFLRPQPLWSPVEDAAIRCLLGDASFLSGLVPRGNVVVPNVLLAVDASGSIVRPTETVQRQLSSFLCGVGFGYLAPYQALVRKRSRPVVTVTRNVCSLKVRIFLLVPETTAEVGLTVPPVKLVPCLFPVTFL